MLYFIKGTTQFSSAVFRNINFERPGNPPPQSQRVNLFFTTNNSNNNCENLKNSINGIIRFDSTWKNFDYNYNLGSSDKFVANSIEKPKIGPQTNEPYKLEKRKILDDDILDVLNYQEAIFLDIRTLCEILTHLMKEKLIIFSSFFTISVYEPYPIQIMYLLLSLSITLFINSFLFLEQYFSRRYLTIGKLGIAFLFEYELDKCAISGAVSAVLLYILSLFFTLRKKIKYQKYFQKEKETFYIEIEKLIKKFKRYNIISIILWIIFTILIGFYLTVFIEVYPKSYFILLQGYGISILFCLLFQILICLFVVC